MTASRRKPVQEIVTGSNHQEMAVSVVRPTATLIPAQGELLREAMDGEIPPHALDYREGPKGTTLTYLKHGYVTATLNEVFGPFWSYKQLDIEPGKKFSLIEYPGERYNKEKRIMETVTIREVSVMIELRIRIFAADGTLISEEYRPGTGGKIWEKNISFTDTLQSADSEALKRAAFRFGKKFGLQLYYDDDARRQEYEEENTIKIPRTVAQLYATMQKLGISDEVFEAVVGYELGSVGESGKPRPEEKDIALVWTALMEVYNGNSETR